MTTMSAEERLIEDVRTGKRWDLDGVMSPLTQRLLKAHGACGVEMTEYWIRTPQNWSCPSCLRTKEQTVRKNLHNQLICKLVVHHDHMKDLLLERFRVISASLKQVVADDVAERFAKRSASMVSSYDNVVICQDCNSADAKAKSIAGAHPRFSYSPSEIQQFVVPSDNRPHDIRDAIAKQLWQDTEATFALRLKIVDRIAEIAATKSHWYQEVSFRYHPETIVRGSDGTIHYYYDLHRLPYHALGGGGEVVKDHSSWRVKPYTRPKEVPSQGDCDHAAKVTSLHHWNKVSDDWKCPVCKRSKCETVRKNNKNERNYVLNKGTAM